MSILEKIRTGTESGPMRVVLGIIVIVFVFWGIGTGRSPTNQVVATVNGERITDTRFHAIMKRQSRSQQGSLTEEQHRAQAQEALSALIREEVLLQEAHHLGIQVSDDEIARTILDIPAFSDESGAFSEELYVRYLKQFGTTKGSFEEDIRNSLIVSRLREMAAASVTVSDEEIRERWNEEMTSFQLEVVPVRTLDFYDDVQPSDVEVETFVAENRPEIRAWYDEHYATRFHKPRRAELRLILLRAAPEGEQGPDLAQRMEAIRAELAGGAEFAELARKYSEDLSAENGGLLGEVRFDQVDPAMATAIFGPEGKPDESLGVRPPVLTDAGLQLVEVVRMLPEETVQEDAARSEIARTLLQERKAPELAAAWAERLRSAWAAAPEPPLALLAEQGLAIQPESSLTLANPSIEPFGPLPALGQALRGASSGQVLGAVVEAPEAWLVVRVAERSEPDPARFATELPMLKPRIELLARMEFVESWAADLVARAKVKQLAQF